VARRAGRSIRSTPRVRITNENQGRTKFACAETTRSVQLKLNVTVEITRPAVRNRCGFARHCSRGDSSIRERGARFEKFCTSTPSFFTRTWSFTKPAKPARCASAGYEGFGESPPPLEIVRVLADSRPVIPSKRSSHAPASLSCIVEAKSTSGVVGSCSQGKRRRDESIFSQSSIEIYLLADQHLVKSDIRSRNLRRILPLVVFNLSGAPAPCRRPSHGRNGTIGGRQHRHVHSGSASMRRSPRWPRWPRCLRRDSRAEIR